MLLETAFELVLVDGICPPHVRRAAVAKSRGARRPAPPAAIIQETGTMKLTLCNGCFPSGRVERRAPVVGLPARVLHHVRVLDGGGRGRRPRGPRARARARAPTQVHALPGAPRGHALRTVPQPTAPQVLLPLLPGLHQATARIRGQYLAY